MIGVTFVISKVFQQRIRISDVIRNRKGSAHSNARCIHIFSEESRKRELNVAAHRVRLRNRS